MSKGSPAKAEEGDTTKMRKGRKSGRKSKRGSRY